MNGSVFLGGPARVLMNKQTKKKLKQKYLVYFKTCYSFYIGYMGHDSGQSMFLDIVNVVTILNQFHE